MDKKFIAEMQYINSKLNMIDLKYGYLRSK